MKNFHLPIECSKKNKQLLTLFSLFLFLFPLSIQAALAQGPSEDQEHTLYQAGSLYGERNEIRFFGVVQKIPQEGQIGTWVVDGSNVLVSETTAITGEPTVGSFVELDGSWLVRNNTFKAYDLKVLNQVDPLSTGELTGTVEDMPTVNWPYGIWIIESRKVNVQKGLELNEQKGKAKIGATVAIKGRYIDGVFTASEFEIKAAGK